MAAFARRHIWKIPSSSGMNRPRDAALVERLSRLPLSGGILWGLPIQGPVVRERRYLGLRYVDRVNPSSHLGRMIAPWLALTYVHFAKKPGGRFAGSGRAAVVVVVVSDTRASGTASYPANAGCRQQQ